MAAELHSVVLLLRLRSHLHIKSSHSLRQNDGKLQNHPPTILNLKIPNLPKIDVYNFKYKISARNIRKLSFLHKSASINASISAGIRA